MTEFKKKFGQNFISDKNLIKAIVGDALVTKDDTVIEIGAGAGALTKELSLCAKKVVSFEIDKDLEGELLALELKNVDFVFADFMKCDLKSLEEDLGEYKVVANLPYYITTPIIFKFLEESESVELLVVMVQKEVAERMIAKPCTKEYGVLTVMLSFFGETKIMREVGRQMFNPMPNVDSAVVKITINREKFQDVNKKEFYSFVKACFSMRRKTLLNCLSKKYSRAFLKQKLSEEMLARRAETMSTDELVRLFLLLSKEA